MSAYLRISRGQPAGLGEYGAKRLAHHGTVVAVSDDGKTEVDLSACVSLSEIIFKAGDIERAVVTFIGFEVES